MVEGTEEYLNRKMEKVQQIIEDATNAKALGAPAITDGFNPVYGGAFIEIKLVINETKYNEFLTIKKGKNAER